jgi:hypothetical protein
MNNDLVHGGLLVGGNASDSAPSTSSAFRRDRLKAPGAFTTTRSGRTARLDIDHAHLKIIVPGKELPMNHEAA